MSDVMAQSQDWVEARRLVAQARGEIKAAGDLAHSLGDTLSAKGGIDKAKDAGKLAASEADLRKQTLAAQTQPHADLAAEEFKNTLAALDTAAKQIKANEIEPAKASLTTAADLLVKAKTVQAEHARFEASHKLLDDRAKALQTLTDPPAAQLKGMVDPLVAKLAEAVQLEKAKDPAKAGEALRAAEPLAAEAEQFRDLRKKFNADVVALELRRDGLADPLKGQVTAMIAKATQTADAFDINYATRYLENAEAQVEGDNVGKLAASNPDDPKFLESVKKMLAARGGDELSIKTAYVKGGKVGATPSVGLSTKERTGEADPTKVKQSKEMAGGAELLDEIAAKLGKGLVDIDPTDDPVVAAKKRADNAKITKAIAIIAKERFGIDLSMSLLTTTGGKTKEGAPTVPGSEHGDEETATPVDTKRAKTASKIYEMLARVPEQSENNPSMKKFERRDAFKTNPDGTVEPGQSSGGFYQSDGDLVVMSGRANDSSKQKFGSQNDALARQIFGGTDKMLPPREDPVYDPVDEAEIDYFDFASVHEVGHAVDDRLRFMASRAGNAAFGGWTVHGGALDPIAKAVSDDVVGKNPGADAAAVQQFVADMMVGAKPDIPSVEEPKQADTKNACDAATAWHAIATNEQVWWSQTQTDAITLNGKVYQEAYAGTWVSYPAAERAKGITGYQFRAPGEWFAELYAAYHMGKLKNGHPARKWLSTLSL